MTTKSKRTRRISRHRRPDANPHHPFSEEGRKKLTPERYEQETGRDSETGESLVAGAGRPSDYRPEYDRMALWASKRGAGIQDLAGLFNTSVSSIKRWMTKHPSFRTAIKDGNDEFNTMSVEACLLDRALGFTYDEVTSERKPIYEDNQIVGYDMTETKRITKTVPPDTGAAVFWLVNRTRDTQRWMHVQRVIKEFKGHMSFSGIPEQTQSGPEDEVTALAKAALILSRSGALRQLVAGTEPEDAQVIDITPGGDDERAEVGRAIETAPDAEVE